MRKTARKAQHSLIHHLVTINLVQTVPILDCLEMLKMLFLSLSALPSLYFGVSQRLRRHLNM